MPDAMGYGMTLAYGLISEGGIVLAADSQFTYPSFVFKDGGLIEVATYISESSKIKPLNCGGAVAMSGDVAYAGSLLDAAESIGHNSEMAFQDVLDKHARCFAQEHRRVYKGHKSCPHCSFLFCGYDTRRCDDKIVSSPVIVKLSSYNQFSPAPVGCTSCRYGFIGREDHGGALYLHHRFFPRASSKLSLESAKCLAYYCVISEVIRQDNTVGEPIGMAVITPSGMKMITRFDGYRDRLKRIEDSTRAILDEPF